MERRRRIVIYGNSVILGTLTATLRRNPRFEVFTLSPVLPDSQGLKDLTPDVIVFDLEAARPEAAFSLLERLPGLLVVGISPDKNVVKTWSGQQLKELSTQDLMRVIEGQHGGFLPSYAGNRFALQNTAAQERSSTSETNVSQTTTRDTTNGGGKG